VREAALRYLRDPALLAEVARSAKHEYARKEAVARLEDYADPLGSDEAAGVRAEAAVRALEGLRKDGHLTGKKAAPPRSWEGCKCESCGQDLDSNGICKACGHIDWTDRRHVIERVPKEGDGAPGDYSGWYLHPERGTIRVEATAVGRGGGWIWTGKRWTSVGARYSGSGRPDPRLHPIKWEIRAYLQGGTLDGHYAVHANDFEELLTGLSSPEED